METVQHNVEIRHHCMALEFRGMYLQIYMMAVSFATCLPMGKDLPALPPRALHTPAHWLARLRMPPWRIATWLIGARQILPRAIRWAHRRQYVAAWRRPAMRLALTSYSTASLHLCAGRACLAPHVQRKLPGRKHNRQDTA